MTIRVRFFAILRDRAGTAATTLDLPADATVQTAAAALIRQFPAIEPYLTRCAYAVNQSYMPSDTPLNEGDELAIIPPVSGG
jgi:molybdopterin converting factor subunit 1